MRRVEGAAVQQSARSARLDGQQVNVAARFKPHHQDACVYSVRSFRQQLTARLVERGTEGLASKTHTHLEHRQPKTRLQRDRLEVLLRLPANGLMMQVGGGWSSAFEAPPPPALDWHATQLPWERLRTRDASITLTRSVDSVWANASDSARTVSSIFSTLFVQR